MRKGIILAAAVVVMLSSYAMAGNGGRVIGYYQPSHQSHTTWVQPQTTWHQHSNNGWNNNGWSNNGWGHNHNGWGHNHNTWGHNHNNGWGVSWGNGHASFWAH